MSEKPTLLIPTRILLVPADYKPKSEDKVEWVRIQIDMKYCVPPEWLGGRDMIEREIKR